MKYRKTELIEAEQFDGSDEMIERYDIAEIPQADNTDKPWKCFIFTLEGNVELNINDWIATGVNGEHWAISDDVFKKTYAKLPVIPYNVAVFIKSCKENNIDLRDVLYFENNGFDYVKEDEARIDDWIADHQDKVIDSLGDMLVVMIIFCQQQGLSLIDCLQEARDTIMDRKGKTVNGVFIKESDLQSGD